MGSSGAGTIEIGARAAGRVCRGRNAARVSLARDPPALACWPRFDHLLYGLMDRWNSVHPLPQQQPRTTGIAGLGTSCARHRASRRVRASPAQPDTSWTMCRIKRTSQSSATALLRPLSPIPKSRWERRGQRMRWWAKPSPRGGFEPQACGHYLRGLLGPVGTQDSNLRQPDYRSGALPAELVPLVVECIRFARYTPCDG
jgi:hypothetical protein